MDGHFNHTHDDQEELNASIFGILDRIAASYAEPGPLYMPVPSARILYARGTLVARATGDAMERLAGMPDCDRKGAAFNVAHTLARMAGLALASIPDDDARLAALIAVGNHLGASSQVKGSPFAQQ